MLDCQRHRPKWLCDLCVKWIFLLHSVPAIVVNVTPEKRHYAKSRQVGLCVLVAACIRLHACGRRIFEQEEDCLRLCVFERQVLRLHDRGQDARSLRLWHRGRTTHEGSASRQRLGKTESVRAGEVTTAYDAEL